MFFVCSINHVSAPYLVLVVLYEQAINFLPSLALKLLLELLNYFNVKIFHIFKAGILFSLSFLFSRLPIPRFFKCLFMWHRFYVVS